MRIGEGAAGQLADMGQRRLDLGGEFGGILMVIGVMVGADFGRNGEAGRHRQAEIGHFRQIGAFAAKKVLHGAGAFSLAVAK